MAFQSDGNSTVVSIAPSSGPNEEPNEETDRFFLGLFMLIVTLFIFFFAIWTYRVTLKRLFRNVSDKQTYNEIEDTIISCFTIDPDFCSR